MSDTNVLLFQVIRPAWNRPGVVACAAALFGFGSPAAAESDFDLTGRVIYDYSRADADNSLYEVGDGELRTARIGFSVTLFDQVNLKAELATDASGEVFPTDVYVESKIGGGGPKLRIGQLKTPNSLDEQTSGRFTATHERAAFTDSFELGRGVGITLMQKVNNVTLTIGVFGQAIKGQETFGGYQVAGRAVFAKEFAGDLQLHLGGSFRYRGLNDNQSDFTYRQRPVTHNSGGILSTGEIARSDLFIGLEAALTDGRFWAAGEYAATFANCPACRNDPALSGGYVEGGVMFGGKKVLSGGKFQRLEDVRGVHDGGLGAVGLVARFDMIDLRDGGVDGGSYRSVTVGADWWPTSHIRLGVNGFVVDNRFGNVMAGLDPAFSAAVMNAVPDDTVKGVNLRAQFDF